MESTEDSQFKSSLLLLEKELKIRDEKIALLVAEQQDLKAQNAQLQDYLKLAKQHRFGRKSEKTGSDKQQPLLGLEVSAA
jgi:hypothetical protein